MSTLPQVLNSSIAFRCEQWLSEAVRIEAVRRRSTLQKICAEALINYLGLKPPAKTKRTRAAAQESSRA